MPEPKSIQNEIDGLNSKAMPVATTLYAEQTIKWIKELNKLKSLSSFITLSPLSKSLRNLYDKHLTLSYLTGYDQMKESVDSDNSFVFSVEKDLHSYDEAIRIMKAKKIMPIAEYDAMTRAMRDSAFSIARIERLGAINEIRNYMINIIEDGGTLVDFNKGLPKIFESYGTTPLKPYHIENVFRTNTQSVYNISRYKSIINDKNVPGLQYSAINDSRTREDHLQWDGMKFPKTDPIWNSLYPPLDYQCRCTVIAITLGRIERDKIKLKSGTKGQISKAKKISPEFNTGKDLKQYNNGLNRLKDTKQSTADSLDKKQKGLF